jgi:transcriptional regulator with XRE-family HTH domain
MNLSYLANARRAKKMTQLQMSEVLGIAISSYNMYEKGSRRISQAKACRIAEILEFELNDVFIPASYVSKQKSQKISKGAITNE